MIPLVFIQNHTDFNGSQMSERQEFKMWLVGEVYDKSYCTIAEAHAKVSMFEDSPGFEESFKRWKALNQDIILASSLGVP